MMKEFQLNQLKSMFNEYYSEEFELFLSDKELEVDIMEMINPQKYEDKQILVSTKDCDEEILEYAVYIDFKDFSIKKEIDFYDWQYTEKERVADNLDDFIDNLAPYLNFDKLYHLNADEEDILNQYGSYKSTLKTDEGSVQS